jgi:hypothetical protein
MSRKDCGLTPDSLIPVMPPYKIGGFEVRDRKFFEIV